MCKETFRRLPEEKRNRILNAAWDEFTTVPFAGASINQIIRRAGIPRGSFYQYFTDKSDLFSCLMDDVRGQVTQIVRGILSEARGDIFRTALMAYERFQEQREQGLYPLTDRLIRVMGINPKFDLESFVQVRPDEFIKENYLKDIDLSAFRRRDTAYILTVCHLIAFGLAEAIMDSLCGPPEREAENREKLAETLQIIRRGSIRLEILSREVAAEGEDIS